MSREQQQALIAEGRASYTAGTQPTDNPYRVGTAENGYWFSGWAEAAMERRGPIEELIDAACAVVRRDAEYSREAWVKDGAGWDSDMIILSIAIQRARGVEEGAPLIPAGACKAEFK